jgi:hypothetical protein
MLTKLMLIHNVIVVIMMKSIFVAFKTSNIPQLFVLFVFYNFIFIFLNYKAYRGKNQSKLTRCEILVIVINVCIFAK